MQINSQLPSDAIVLTSRFVLTLKKVGTATDQQKARLVAQDHTNPDKSIIVHESATVKH